MPEQNPAETPNSGTALCVGCGMCCDGTLFSKGKATAQEVRQPGKAGAEFFTEGDNIWFRQPCHFAEDGRCTNYQERFAVCRKFRCKLLKAYENGEVGLEEARERVKRAFALRVAVTEEEPGAAVLSKRVELCGEFAESNERPRLYLNMVALDHYLDRFFRDKPLRGPASEEVMG